MHDTKNNSSLLQRISNFKWRRFLIRTLVSVALLLAGVSFVPYLWCSRNADAWYRGDAELQQELARGVEEWVSTDLTRGHFSTGSSQFNGEWLFGTYLMAGLGFGQMALEHPELKERHVELMAQCIEKILSPEVRAFDRESWGDDPIESLDSDSDHAAYLGYFNILLSLHRQLEPESQYADLNDRITESLVRRVKASDILLIQSYPFEVYPVDNCAVIGSIGLHARATGTERTEMLSRWRDYCRDNYVDPESGLLYQAVDPCSGDPIDEPRGSGTVLGLYFLSFSDPDFSEQLYGSVKKSLFGRVFGFGAVKEYPPGKRSGRGDIDSGPVVFGFGLSPTGFLIAGTRIHADRDGYRRLFATAYAWGAPYEKNDRLNFVTGGPLGDAILFAMLTASPGTQASTGNSQ
jgi:hypothetical protein